MSITYRQAYATLTDFIANHPEIEIKESVTSIPGDVRPEFYHLFNAVKDALIEEKFSTYLTEAFLLGERYRSVEESTAKLLSLEEPVLTSFVYQFLHNPKECLTKELFNPLFDLLKGRESIDSFEAKASFHIEQLFPFVLRGGYEKWILLSLVDLLDVDKTLRVYARSLAPAERLKLSAQPPKDDAPLPTEATDFLFSQPRNAIFTVPDIIVHSSRLDQFVGIRSEFCACFFNTWDLSPKREWYPINNDLLVLLDYGLTLIYTAEQAEDIALVADATNICRPDLVLWCVDSESLTQDEAVEIMTQANNLLKPIKGSYIITNHPWPEPLESAETDPQKQMPEATRSETDQPEAAQPELSGIHIINVGYDPSNVTFVAETLTGLDATMPTIESAPS